MRRRRRSTRKGQVRKTARRAYSRRRSNPVRRRRSVRRRNPAGDILQRLLAIGAGAAIASYINYTADKNIVDKGVADSWVPEMLQTGWGRALTNVGIGAAVAMLSDKGKGSVKKFGPDVGAAFVAVGITQGIYHTMRSAGANGNGAAPPAAGENDGLGRLVHAGRGGRHASNVDLNAMAGLYAGSPSSAMRSY